MYYQTIQIIFFSLSLMGILGNTLNIMIFSRRPTRKSFINKLLLILYTIDLFIVGIVSLETLTMLILKQYLKNLNGFLCRSFTFFGYFLIHLRNTLSASTLVQQANTITQTTNQKSKSEILSFSIVNSLSQIRAHSARLKTSIYTTTKDSVRATLKKQNKCHFILSSILILLILANVHFLIFVRLKPKLNSEHKTYHVVANESTDIYDTLKEDLFNMNRNEHTIKYVCSSFQDDIYDYFKSNYWFWIDMSLTLIIPCVIMNFAFIYIWFYLAKLNRRYAHFLSNQDYKSNHRIYLLRMRKNKKMILRIFVSNFYFLLSVMPLYLFQFYLNTDTIEFIDVNLIKSLLVILFYSNNVLNFFAKFLCSPRFRKHFYALLNKNS
jgi:hypothetical protein